MKFVCVLWDVCTAFKMFCFQVEGDEMGTGWDARAGMSANVSIRDALPGHCAVGEVPLVGEGLSTRVL